MQDILFQTISGPYGNLGKILLNRPNRLNALSFVMCQQIIEYLEKWAEDPNLKAIILTSALDKVFCAGGDIRGIYELVLEKNFKQAMNFFKTEYALNQLIKEYPKPIISLLDGVTMGGGAGIAIHGSHAVATERLIWAMPETKIGFYPDVGLGYYLARMPQHVGYYLALTGEKIGAAAALKLGIIKQVVYSQNLKKLEKSLLAAEFTDQDPDKITNIIQDFSIPQEQLSFLDYDKYFSGDSVEESIDQLHQAANDESVKILSSLLARSPTSLLVTFVHLQRAKTYSVSKVLAENYVLSSNLMHNHDFIEGVRAVLVDKDQKPNWQPNAINKVKKNSILKFFSVE